ncbi:MAG: protein-methionine-sulfoxide reductase catalytic subunit MsrP [Bauldia sp.]
MSVRTRGGWELPEGRATPEAIYLNRRTLIAGAAVLAGASAIGGVLLNRRDPEIEASRAAASDPSRGLYPAARSPRYAVARAVTPEVRATTWNNFYEFGAAKNIVAPAHNLVVRPWEMRIDGLVASSFTLGIDDLLKRVSLEERVYRHRCAEGWSMVVPWTGFPLKALVDMAKPLGSAKYLRMESFYAPDIASGQKQSWYPWPYVEALTLAEAGNDLAFLVTGAYGKPAAKSMGAPIRLAVPWKYGFKSIKSIVRFSFVESRPATFWPQLDTRFGFWANVSPATPHQASEHDLATGEAMPTLPFNGYGEFVAGLYAGMDAEPLYI